MTSPLNSIPKTCPNCKSSQITYKAKADLWECENCEERFSGKRPEFKEHTTDKLSKRPKSIFFSYGHDANKEFVLMLRQDLLNRGHEISIDFKEIGTWDDWKGKITRGIDKSELAIAFLSKHAIRDPGVCRNEIAIALNRFGTVYPLLLEYGIEQDIPVTIRNLQWPDLSQWRDIRDGKVPGVDWDRWYEEKLLNIIEKLEGHATTFADETSILRKALNPPSFESKFTQHIPGFIGREWVVQAYRQWLEKDSRLFWIKAGPGMGKSAISANLAHYERSAIVASWFCDAKSLELKDPANALRSIAFQLAIRWEDYRVRLMRQLQLGANASDEMCDNAWKALKEKNIQDLFRFLLAEPLDKLIWREYKLVIVIDALDEGESESGANLMTELISRELHSLPDWISFVVTSRPEADVVNRLQGFKAFELDTQDARNQADLRLWLQANLGQRAEIKALSPEVQKNVEDMLIERSAGMILYLKVVEEGFVEGSLTVDTLNQLEAGLPGIFRRYYDSFLQRFSDDYDQAIKPFLRLLHAAGGPLPKDLACAVLQWNGEQFLACRNRLGSYVQETAAGYELFHKTLGEWLGDTASGLFYLDRTIGRQAIADVFFAEFSINEIHTLRWPDLLGKWLPNWLPGLRQNGDAISLNQLGDVLMDRVDYTDAQNCFERALSVAKAEVPAHQLDIAASLNNLASLMQTTGRYKEADPLCREALTIWQTVLPAGHETIALGISNFASLLEATGRYDEAERLYYEALVMFSASLPAGHRRIASCLNNLGGLMQKMGRYGDAEAFCNKALEIRRASLPAGHPDIATSLNNLASVLKKMRRYEEAELLLREALALRRALPAGRPDIFVSLNNLANLLELVGRDAEAEPLLHEALAISRATLPAGHPDIATSLNDLAVLLFNLGHSKAAEPLLAEALEIRKAALPAGHPNIENSFNNLATLRSALESKPE